ncbi:type II CRISPR-associated endonuclease Cas1 [Treponema pedis]|uniref:CRISPR-associated endonuclease Cas1 n=3 Tax=Treponema pedis TaxID=409322 RepID=S5ZSU5_9SPIR|nr:type II CRISPR-associated endonuclease Cas1 [Treponema pedis]AGT43185.1 CRISPR-associated protein Cas1 [Treponema pedis str. T A4]QOW60751.1 type II CRISPR-associated endonuclease Cas1 [Treponema pedis]QSI04020.1 type II CRISPR-associated endonuclease Cas1 [Treponema pedis]
MIKRTLFFSNAVCLTVKNKQLIILNKHTQEEASVPIEDIGFVVIENNQSYISIPVINELTKNNASVIFCDEKHMPLSMSLLLDGNSVQNQIFAAQINASLPVKKNCWKIIVCQKIKNQAALLKKYGHRNEMLVYLASEVKTDDHTNREGIAAKKYWDSLFGSDWLRARYGAFPNNLLNYGYAILRAATARALVGSGLLPTLGIHHHNKYNAYALADDIMEPYRPYVDDCVCQFIKENPDEKDVNQEFKKMALTVLTCDCKLGKCTRPLLISLTYTASSFAQILTGKTEKLQLPEF